MTFMTTPWPLPGGSRDYNLSRLFIGHYYNTLSLSDLCPGVEQKIFFYKAHFPCITYFATP